MPKKRKSKPDKPAKPKKNDGLKLPGGMNISADSLAGVLTSPLVRELAADVLIAVAGALAANRSAKAAAANLGANASAAGEGAANLGQTATGAVAEVVSEAARRILPSAAVEEAKRGLEQLAGESAPKKRKTASEQRREH